jgi:hypothetical protein
MDNFVRLVFFLPIVAVGVFLMAPIVLAGFLESARRWERGLGWALWFGSPVIAGGVFIWASVTASP